MYALKRTGSWGGYVAPPGGKASYVVRKEHAQTFETREAAEAAKCGNEIVVRLRD